MRWLVFHAMPLSCGCYRFTGADCFGVSLFCNIFSVFQIVAATTPDLMIFYVLNIFVTFSHLASMTLYFHTPLITRLFMA
jgi:hypothetical protein